MPSILVTGSNRGLGLEWVRQYAELGWRVYATCRLPAQADELQHLAARHTTISLHRLDVTSAEHLQTLIHELGNASLDLLINNAGAYFERWARDRLGQIDYRDWLETFNVNTLGPMRVTEALRANLARGDNPLVVAITSHMGSITDISSPNDYAYRSSKSALNAAMKGLAYELRPFGIGVLLLHPGWARTRMGGSNAPYTVEQSVSNMRKLVEGFSMQESGHFYRHDGVEIPW